jgi:transposase
VFLRDGRVCLTNNAAERALRGIALGRKAWLFAGSDRGGQRAMFSLITTALCRMRHSGCYAERRTIPNQHSPAAVGLTLRAVGSA